MYSTFKTTIVKTLKSDLTGNKKIDEAFGKAGEALGAAGDAMSEAFDDLFKTTEDTNGEGGSMTTDDMNVKVKGKSVTLNGDIDSVTVNGKEVYLRGK